MEEVKKILLLGAGGHCLSVLDSLLSSYSYNEIGIIDNPNINEQSQYSKRKEHSIMGVPIVGCDDDLERLYSEGYREAFITLGSIGDITIRKKLYQLIKNIGFFIPNIIDKSSVISNYVSFGEGIYVGKNAAVNSYCEIGNLAIINTSTTIEHECIIEDYVHVSPGSTLCGNVKIGMGTHIGAGSVVKQGVNVGAEAMIGMGSVVVKDIDDKVTAYGKPCREGNYE